MSPGYDERRPLTRASWLVLAFCAALLLATLALTLYRFHVPTDGWTYHSGPVGSDKEAVLIYDVNLTGSAFPLRPGDLVIAVAGVPVAGGDMSRDPAARLQLAGVRKGSAVEYSIVRAGQPLRESVTLAEWTAASWVRHSTQPGYLVLWLAALLMLGVGLFAFAQRPYLQSVQILLVWCTAVFSTVVSNSLPDSLYVFLDPLAYLGISQLSYSTFPVLLAPSILAFSLVFPRPKGPIRRRPWLVAAPYFAGFCVAVVIQVAPGLGWPGFLGSLLLMTGSTIVSLVHSALTQRDAVSRSQLRWAVGGIMLGVVVWMLGYLPSLIEIKGLLADILSYSFSLGFAIIGLSLAVAVLRYRLFDVDLVVNRTLVYAVMTACVIAIYVAVVGYLGMLFRTPGNLALSLVATGIVAVAFAPLKSIVQGSVNRLMYGERDDPYGLLTRLAKQLESTGVSGTAFSVVAQTLVHALKLPYVAIAVQQDGIIEKGPGGINGWRIVAEQGLARPEVVRFPLVHAGVTIGELIASNRVSGEPFSGSDRRLLSDLARHIAVAAHARLLAGELEQARLGIITAREETRRRLGTDLHDGVGHQVAGLARQVERTGLLLRHDPAAADQLLREVGAGLSAVSVRVRQLAHQLYPPELELLGLVDALAESVEAHFEAHPVVRIEIATPIPALPTVVESAAYYIALEGLTNVTKHAQAQVCTLRLSYQQWDPVTGSPSLELEICDDGRGMPASAVSGLGLLSMRARADELGGACSIEAPPGGGTRIAVRLPCAAA